MENFEVFKGFRCLAFSAKITKLRYFPVTLLQGMIYGKLWRDTVEIMMNVNRGLQSFNVSFTGKGDEKGHAEYISRRGRS